MNVDTRRRRRHRRTFGMTAEVHVQRLREKSARNVTIRCSQRTRAHQLFALFACNIKE